MTTLRLLTGILLPAVLLTGCGTAPLQPDSPTVARVAASTPEDYERLWEAASHALRQRYFTLDRQDRSQGVITTFPETTAMWFEVWRPQPKPMYYRWEAHLQTIQRQVTVTMPPVISGGERELGVKIERLRYSLPERQIDNSAAAMRLYSGVAPTEEGRMEKPSESGYWIPLGRDGPMEERLLADIIKHYGLPPPPGSPASDEQ